MESARFGYRHVFRMSLVIENLNYSKSKIFSSQSKFELIVKCEFYHQLKILISDYKYDFVMS